MAIGWALGLLQDQHVEIRAKRIGRRYTDLRRCSRACIVEIYPPLMFEDFTATDPLTQQAFHCEYQCLIVGIATRHSDTVDIKFLVNGQGVWLGLPHPAWVEFKRLTGVPLSDRMAVDLAGCYLKRAIESGLGAEGHHWNDITVAEVLDLAASLHWIPAAAASA